MLNRWFKKGRPQREIVPIERVIDRHVLATKDSGYLVGFSVPGIDGENLTREMLEQQTSRIAAVKNSLPSGCILYEYLLKRRGFNLRLPASAHVPPGLGREIAQKRADFLMSTGGLGSISLYWVLFTPGRKIGRQKDRESHRKVALKELGRTAKTVQERLKNTTGARLLDADATAGMFGYILNLDERLLRRKLVSRFGVDRQLALRGLKWEGEEGNHLRIGRKYAQMFSLKERPAGTRPNLFGDLMTLDCDMVLRCRWEARDTPKTRSEIERQEFYGMLFNENLNVAAVHAIQGKELPRTAASVANEKKVTGLSEILNEIDSERRKYGNHSLIGMIHSDELAEVEHMMPRVASVFNEPEAEIIEETQGAMSAYYAMLPGNEKYDVRGAWVQDKHAARMSLVYAPAMANPKSDTGPGKYVAVFETRDSTPYFWSRFVHGAGGTFVGGATGRGKTYLANFLLMSELKDDPIVIVFDVGYSYESTILNAGGVVTRVGLDGPRINPFDLEPTEANLNFLTQFIRMLLLRGGADVRPEDDTTLAEKIGDMYLKPEGVRQLRYLILPRHLQIGLRKWIGDGPYGKIFDNQRDELKLARLQGFDFSALSASTETVGASRDAELIECILYWLVARANSIIEDPDNLAYPKHLIFDEIWRQMKNPQIFDFALNGLKRGRTNRAGATLVTQSPADLGENGVIIKNSIMNWFLLGEDELNRDLYRAEFGLNEKQLDNIASLEPAWEVFHKTAQHSKVLRLRMDPMSHALFTTDPTDKALRQALTAEHGFSEGMKRFAATLGG